jgi:hypothetical protein
MGPTVLPRLVLALQMGHRRDRAGGVSKDAQDPVAQLLDQPPAVGFDGVADPLRHLRDRLCRPLVAQGLIQGRTARYVCKDHRRQHTHERWPVGNIM